MIPRLRRQFTGLQWAALLLSEGLNVQEAALPPAERAVRPSAAAYAGLGRLHTPQCDPPSPSQPRPIPIPAPSQPHHSPSPARTDRARPTPPPTPVLRRHLAAGGGAAQGGAGASTQPRLSLVFQYLVGWFLAFCPHSRLVLRNWFCNICSARPHPFLPVHNSVLCWLFCRAPRVPTLTMFITAKSRYAKDESALITRFNSFPRDFPKSGPAELSFPWQVWLVWDGKQLLTWEGGGGRKRKENTPNCGTDRLEYNELSSSWLESPEILRAVGEVWNDVARMLKYICSILPLSFNWRGWMNQMLLVETHQSPACNSSLATVLLVCWLA